MSPWPTRRIKAFIVFAVLLAGALAGSFIFLYYTSPIPNWTSSIVDSSTGGVSAAVGPAGELFVSYSSAGVKVASLTGGAWRTIYADQNERYALSTGISVDSSGAFHLVYTYDPANHSVPPSLRAITNRGGTMHFYAFGPDSILPSVTADSNRTGHIAFFYGRYAASNPGIGYATDALDAVSAVRIARTEPWARSAVQIAVGPSDAVFIGAALDASAGGVGYFTRETSGWQFHQVENVTVPFAGLAMKVDASGAIHMAYALPGNPDSPAVRYATNRGGTWSLTTIPGIGGSRSTMSAGSYLSMVLDRPGHVHLLGFGPRTSDPDGSVIVYATDAGGPWATSTVMIAHLVEFSGAPISLAIASDGRVHVLYTSGGPRDSSLIDTVNVPGGVPLAEVLQQWEATARWILLAAGIGLLAVWLATRILRYEASLQRKRKWAEAKSHELRALRRGPL